MDDIRAHFLSRLHHYRSEDVHESRLISARMLWLIIIEASLVIAFAIIFTYKDPQIVLLLTVIFSTTAMFFANIITSAVRKAEVIVHDWHMKEKALYKEIKALKDYELMKELESYFIFKDWEIHDEKEEKEIADAFSFQRSLFPAIAILWSAILLLSTYNFLEYKTDGVLGLNRPAVVNPK
ncbi:MAG TPA: hypothetical protein VFT64_07490 [Rickettsiales bacterium]|nr:hypothetical protein [Rickettsiales bacterium]